MDLTRITDLFGRSVYDPLIDEALAEHGARCKHKAALNRYDTVKSAAGGLAFTFWYKGFYAEQVAAPKSVYLPDGEEVVLYEMTFRPPGLEDVRLPYGLRFGDTADVVQKTLGRKPFSKGKNVGGEKTWTYFDDDFELLVVFDQADTLAWFRIWALTHASRRKRDTVENISRQKENIKPERAEAVEGHRKAMPIREWARRMPSDKAITPEALAEAERIFVEFIDALAKATRKKSPTSIYSALKKAVGRFNRLAKRHRGFIETQEREEIVEYLQDGVRLSGFVIEDGVDLTEAYRQW
jgi:hypothetical protein